MKDVTEKMEKSIEKIKERLNGVRGNRANTDMLNQIKVDCYGSMIPLMQLASITIPEPRIFLINVFDRNNIQAIEKAISSSNLGFNPQSEGSIIRLTLPELTEERRKDLVKVVSKYCEEGKITIRNIRRDALDKLKNEKQNKEISEDDANKKQTLIQKETDNFIQQIDTIKTKKENDLLQR
ncbi:MAG: ribosome recycling factor [bacterium]